LTDRLYLPKDFVETAEGLLFAVVYPGTEHAGGQDKSLCFLRYAKPDADGAWRKLSTTEANDFLTRHYPHYRFHSILLDADLHGVAVAAISRHHQPSLRLRGLLTQAQKDPVEQDAADLCALWRLEDGDLNWVGVTGSLLPGLQKASSDIDMVVYDRGLFQRLRQMTAKLTASGELGALGEADWRDAYDRRDCSLSFDEYLWHERRKFNKGMINGRKFDLSFVDPVLPQASKKFRKLGVLKIRGGVIGDERGFDYPACFELDHPLVSSVLSFTATYTGQAVVGETVEVSGLLEQVEDGRHRLVVGSSREAPGEYIKVIDR
jgi:uncharacterized protein